MTGDPELQAMYAIAIRTVTTLRSMVTTPDYTGPESGKLILLDAADHAGGIEGLAFSMFGVTNYLLELAVILAGQVPHATKMAHVDDILALLRADMAGE